MKYTLQVAPEDCTGCGLCVEVCPAKDKRQVGRKAINMAPQPPLREREAANWDFFLDLPEVDRAQLNLSSIKNSQLHEAAVRVLGRLRGLRRDALPQAGHAAVRRPRGRSPTPPAARRSTAATCRPRPGLPTARGAARPGPTRSSRTTPSSAWACG